MEKGSTLRILNTHVLIVATYISPILAVSARIYCFLTVAKSIAPIKSVRRKFIFDVVRLLADSGGHNTVASRSTNGEECLGQLSDYQLSRRALLFGDTVVKIVRVRQDLRTASYDHEISNKISRETYIFLIILCFCLVFSV